MPPRQVNIQDAKAHLSALIAAVEQGETIVICKRNVPVAKVCPLVEPPIGKRRLGLGLLGIKEIPPEFFEPLSEEELAEYERPIEI